MENKIIMISMSKLKHHPDNPRKNIGDVTELSNSIKAKGILQNLTVVPAESDTYYVVIGNRRLEAAMAAGIEDVPCVISDMDYKTQIETMMVENMQREDLTVVEQAEGMQMMLDLGSSVEEISEKTGFSESTVRRRLKLNEFDMKKVLAAQERGATLEDFVKLEQIKAKSEKNKLLKLLGTADFTLEFKRSLENQKNNEMEKLALRELKTFAEPFPENEDIWSNKWAKVEKLSYSLLKFEKGKRLPKNKTKKYFYRIVKYWNEWEVYIYTENENYTGKEEKPKKSEQEKSADKTVRALNKIAREHYALRKEFVFAIAKNSKIKDYEKICLDTVIKKTAVYGYLSNNYSYNKIISDFFNIDSLYGNEQRILDAYNETPAGTTVLLVYRLLEDNENLNCYYRSYGHKVQFKENSNLNRIYDFLTALGYEMSSEESQIINGTYDLYDK